jgi:hypothetical protein
MGKRGEIRAEKALATESTKNTEKDGLPARIFLTLMGFDVLIAPFPVR